MRLVRAAAVLAAIVDLGFGVLFLVKPNAFHPELDPSIYARWAGLAFLGSAATLFVVVWDPKRFLPALYVNVAVRALAALLTIAHFSLFTTILPSHGALVAILVATLVYEMKLAREPKPVLKGVVTGTAAKAPAKKAAGAKPAPRKKSAPGEPGSG